MSTEESRGLGDTIAKFTHATGLDRVVHAVAGDDCGCEQRRELFNQWFPYRTRTPQEKQQTMSAPPPPRIRFRDPGAPAPQGTAPATPHPLHTLAMLCEAPGALREAAAAADAWSHVPGAADVAAVQFLLGAAGLRAPWSPLPAVFVALLHQVGYVPVPPSEGRLGDLWITALPDGGIQVGLVTARSEYRPELAGLDAEAARTGAPVWRAMSTLTYLLRAAG